MTDILQLIECPICFEIYNQPRILTNCGHTFCTKCIKSHINLQQANIKCFICNQSTKINRLGINSLKINYMFMSLIEYIKNRQHIENLDSVIKNINNSSSIVLSDDMKDINIDNSCCSRRTCYSLSRCMDRRNEE
tara:strand:- start:68 stop:472 length:405 start_codon:yes stop_codon:yes gene_type:complete